MVCQPSARTAGYQYGKKDELLLLSHAIFKK